jgi:DNA-binding CsgD family transcriptional regulator
VPLLEDLEVAPLLSGEHETVVLQRELGLTRAEARVAHRVAAGLTSREIAADLDVAWETVRTHLRNINARLELASQRELVSLIERRRAGRAR